MTVHSPHDDILEAGLAGGCPACRDHTDRPEQTLDRANIARLLRGDELTILDKVAASRLRTMLATGAYLAEIVAQDTGRVDALLGEIT